MMNKRIINAAFFLMAGVLITGCGNDVIARDKHESKLIVNEKRVTEIISKMTLEEKVAMLHGKHMFTSEGVPAQGISDMVYADGPFGIREEMEPHSWNPLHLSNDSSTFFPTGSALAATWSEDLAYEYGTGMAREARLRGKDMILGPAINIQRIPTGGRTYEYLSEDPFLSSRISVGYTKGVQDNGVAVCLKHYALNNQENNRGTVNVIVSPRAMREIYLPPFEAAIVEADAYGVMSAYNKVNGYWCGENDFLLNQVLRKDWGFKGMVISDWGGTHSTVESINAGLNVEMPTSDYHGDALLDSVKAGKVAESVIDQRVREILRVRLLIDPVPEEKANVEMTAKPEQAAIAYRVASKSIVLLKNTSDILPIDINKVKTIAIIGDNTDKKMSSGGVGAGVKALYEITPLQGLKNRIGTSVELVYAQGYSTQSNQRFAMRSRFTNASSSNNSQQLVDEAVSAAKKADLVLFFGGNNRQWETEGSDRTNINLPYNQEAVFNAVAEANSNVVFVIVAGAPVDLRAVDGKSLAIIQSWFNGTEGGNALADILLGNISPSGKLPFSYPIKLEDSPAYALGNYPQTDAEIGQDVFVSLVGNNNDVQNGSSNKTTAVYSEDLLVGYRWFITKNVPVMYPFGHGLSYAKFGYSEMSTSKSKYSDGESIEVSFTIKNQGNMDADEVVQLYVHRIDATIEWPYQELKAFQRVSLQSGEEKAINLSIPVEQLKYWNEKSHKWSLEHGKIELLLGSSSGDIRQTAIVNI